MAVYTHLTARELAQLIACYDVGALVSAKGIAEGVSNSNWLVETEGGAATEGAPARFILTMYERRIEERDLPFFLGLLDHLAAAGCPVPRTIADRDGAAWRRVRCKPVALIEFLPGISVEHPSPAQARNVGRALAELHRRAADFSIRRANGLGPTAWLRLLEGCGDALGTIDPALAAIVGEAMPRLLAEWPDDLPRAIVHADLFPDNVLLRGDTVGGLIDFYFACEDFAAYDLAVTHAAWCFPDDAYDAAIGAALVEGYEGERPLSDRERAALPLLAQGASMRFVATRAADWIDTPAEALVRRKDPMEFARRLAFYAERGDEAFA